MAKINHLKALEILDSRGNPTVSAEMGLSDGTKVRVCVPSGASTGEHEACELRDGDKKRYGGKGVLKACRNIDGPIFKALKGFDLNASSGISAEAKKLAIREGAKGSWRYSLSNQRALDERLIHLDGTANKTKLGANAMLAASLAAAYARAASQGLELFESLGGGAILPIPMMNILNGGSHADNNVDIQEFMIYPRGAKSFREGLRWGAEVFAALKATLKGRKLNTGVGDEGGFAPHLRSNREALDVIMEAIGKAGYRAGKDISLCLDVASSEFHEKGQYRLEAEGGKLWSRDKLIAYYEKLCRDYPIVSIEDGLDQNDWEGWKDLTEALGRRVQLVGDDLFVTNTQFLSRGICEGAGNAVLVKINQIGTLSETKDTVDMAKSAGFGTIMSHRSGETEDSTIADLAVAWDCGQIKTGSLCRTDRVCKYNRLLAIEESLGRRATYGTTSKSRQAR
ncbi:MAG: phosphopyruvate hydratase [Planctomycetota bacterium]